MRTILIGITGASGSIYGIRLLEFFKKSDINLILIVSESAKKIIEYETNYTYDRIKLLAEKAYENDDLLAGPASGSYPVDAMIIIPCSMKTLSAICQGYGDTLISRAASCMLKENKLLILTPRETPVDLPFLKNMLNAKKAGAVVLPAMPGFYHQPNTIDELVDFIVGKILDQLKVTHSLYKKWK